MHMYIMIVEPPITPSDNRSLENEFGIKATEVEINEGSTVGKQNTGSVSYNYNYM